MDYDGRAQIGEGDGSVEVVAQFPDVEHPEWFAHITDSVELPRGEVGVTLLDDGLYNAWHGTALVRDRPGGGVLVGITPLEPPVGA